MKNNDRESIYTVDYDETVIFKERVKIGRAHV